MATTLPKHARIITRVPTVLKDEFEALAARQNLSPSVALRAAMIDYIARHTLLEVADTTRAYARRQDETHA